MCVSYDFFSPNNHPIPPPPPNQIILYTILYNPVNNTQDWDPMIYAFAEPLDVTTGFSLQVHCSTYFDVTDLWNIAPASILVQIPLKLLFKNAAFQVHVLKNSI